MSRGQRLTMHGRDHRPGGADPIPGLADIGDGIKFDTYPQDGDWLYWRTTQPIDAAAWTDLTGLYSGVLGSSSTIGQVIISEFGQTYRTIFGPFYVNANGDLGLFSEAGSAYLSGYEPVVISSTTGYVEVDSPDYVAVSSPNFNVGDDLVLTPSNFRVNLDDGTFALEIDRNSLLPETDVQIGWRSRLGELDMTAGGALTLYNNSTTPPLDIKSGLLFAGFFSIFRLDPDGTVHLRTSASILYDLP